MSQPQHALEYDENGVPYYKWPPFPEAPSGVTITPFKDFKPSGIQVSMDDSNGVELDGEGIPTVQLAVKHDLDAPPRKKKKAKKTATGEDVVKRFIWWEEWAAGEDLRKHHYDQMQNIADIISQAAVDFRSDREWPPSSSRVQEWYDRFIYYIGLDNPKLRPKLRRFQEQEELDEGVSDEDLSDKAASPSGASQVKIEEFDKKQHKIKQDVYAEADEEFRQRLERTLEAQNRRLEAFLNDPELAIKIFFSSYFRDGGMMWENLALRDAPRVVLFFLNFLLRNRTMVGSEKGLRAAVKVAEKARDELPKTKKIGASIPDELASCLTVLFGSRLKKTIWPTRPASDDGDVDEPQAKKPKFEEDPSTAEFNAGLAANGIELVSDDIPPPEAQAENDASVEADGGGWSSIGVGSGNGWGDSTNTVDMDDNPWAQTQPNKGWEEPAHHLMPLLGPTTLPITHTVGYVEESTRYVSSVTMPEVKDRNKELDVGSYSDVLRHFARVELKPYPVFATAERAAIQKPEILEDPLAASEAAGADGLSRIPRHDPEKDSILLLLDPKTAEELLRGMGLGGTFVQVVPDYVSAAAELPSLLGRGKGRGGHTALKSRSSEEIFWYAEKVLQVLPSFWTEKQI